MALTKTKFDWQLVLSETFQELFEKFIRYIPQLVGVISLLVAGWLLAYLLRLFTRKMILAVDAFILNKTNKQGLNPKSVRTHAHFAGNLVFWCVLLFFISASANIFQLDVISILFGKLVNYLPNLVIGLLIILLGFLLSGVTHSTVVSIAKSTGIAQVELLARIAQTCVILVAVVVGVEQVGINVTFITTSLIVVIGVLLAGGALAFGFGARLFVANVIGAQTCRSQFQIGQRIKLGDIEGELLEITQTSLVLETESGQATVPAKLLHELVTEIIAESKNNK